MTLLRRLAVAGLLATLAVRTQSMAAPGEATNVRFCPASKDCLDWDAAVPPGAYRVDRGTEAGLAGLANPTVDSCVFATFAGTSTGAVLTQVPPSGGLYWYLVVATNCAGDGPSGDASFGPRVVNTSGDCSPATCVDGLRDGSESDVDCGGGVCPGCASGQACCAGVDCAAQVCLLSVCAGASCTDLVKNGNETGIDCGGGTCQPCGDGQGCNVNSDCQSGSCSVVGICQPSAPNGSPCVTNSACQSGHCVDTVCCNTACGGTCMACNLGTPGTCSFVPTNGTDNNPPCNGSNACDGAGACKVAGSFPCTTGSECASGICRPNNTCQ